MTRPDPLEPDPTPATGPWEEYCAAARSLAALRRDAAAAAAARTRAASTARAELAQVSAQLARQRRRLVEAAARLGVATPRLTPSAAERTAAGATVGGATAAGATAAGARVGGDPAAVPEALRRCQRLLEAVDSEVAGAGGAGGRVWWPPPLWPIIVGALAVIALAAVWLLPGLLG
jgi:hypothetical protein